MSDKIGFSLEIPDKVFNDLEKVDAAIEQIAKTAKKTSDLVNQEFLSMTNSSGLQSLLTQMKTLKESMSTIGGANKSSAGISNLGDSAKNTIGEVDKLNTVLSQLSEVISKLNTSKNPIQSAVTATTGIDDISKFKTELIALKEAFKQDANIDNYIAKLQQLRNLYPNVAVQANVLGTSLGKLNAISTSVKDALVIGEAPTLVKESEVKQAISLLQTLKSTADEGSDEFNKYRKSIAQYTAQLKAMRSIENTPITYDSAIQASNEAKSIAARIEAIKKLKVARDNLATTDAKYEERLKELNEAIQRNTRLNNEASGAADKLKRSQSGLLNIQQQLARSAALYFSVSQIQGYINKLVKVRGQFELQQKSLQAIMQDKYQADKVWGQIVDLSVRSPFRLSELTAYTKQLAAYRVENEKIFDTTKMLADVSAGLGVDMSRLILAYGQVKAANYLRGTELRQFSEAGINILGELSTYFTEIRGEAVTTADVFEMVSKRMVSFQDVQNIFQRLTGEGGIFFRMQEIQAETLTGKLSNLNDAYDIMLNKIGSSNEGVLKGSLDVARVLVENYEYLVVAINSLLVGFTTYAVKTTLATAANKGFAASNIQATISGGGLASMLARVTKGFSAMTAAMMRNPITLIAVGIAAAIGLVTKRLGDLEDSAKVYDTLTGQINEQKIAFDKITSSMSKQQKVLDSTRGEMDKLSKGTEDYTKAQKANATATAEMESLLAQLKKDYPEIYAATVKITDGTFDLATAQKLYNEQLNDTSRLNYILQKTGGFFDDDIVTEVKDATEAYKDLKNAQQAYTNESTTALGKVRSLLDSGAYGRWNDDIKAVLDDSNKTIDEKTNELREILSKIGSSFSTISGGYDAEYVSAVTKLGDAMKGVTKSLFGLSQAQREYDKETEDMLETATKSFTEYNIGIDKSSKSWIAAAEKTGKELINLYGGTEEKIRNLLAAKFNQIVGVEINLDPAKVEPNLSKLQKEIDDYIKANNLGAISVKIKEGDSVNKYFEDLRAKVKEIDYELEGLDETELNKQLKGTNDERVKQLEEERTAVVKLLTDYDELREKQKRGGDSDSEQKKQLDLLKDQISLIKTMNSEYESLRQNFSDEQALSRVMESFKKSMEDVGLSDFMKEQGLTDSDIANLFDSQKFKTQARKAGKDGVAELNKAFGEYKVQVDIEVQEDKLKQASDEINKLFDQYELTLQLKELNFTQDLAKDLFDFDFTSMDELKKKITENRNALFGLGTAGEKKYQDAMGKITDMEVNAQKERNKRIYELLRQSYTEREQLEIDYQKNLQDIQASNISDTAKQSATTNVTAQYKLDVAELDYKDFKLIDEYIKAFEDLEDFGEATINHLLDVFKKFSKTANLSPETIKVLMDKIQELEDIAIRRNPFEALSRSLRDYVKATKEAKAAQDALEFAEKDVEIAQEEQIDAQKTFDSTDESDAFRYAKAIESLRAANLKLKDSEDAVADATKDASDAEDKRRKSLNEIKLIVSETEKDFNGFADVINDSIDLIKDFAEGMGIALDPESEAVLDGIQKGLTVVAAIFPIITAFLTLTQAQITSIMTMLWPLLAVALLIGAAFAIFGAADAAREKVIEEETRKVEELQTAYEKLEKAFEKAYSFQGLEDTTDEMRKNLEAQITALEKARAAEADKKDTDADAIADYNDQINDNIEALEELQNELLKAQGGIGTDAYKSSAQEFIEAWDEALLETGDGLTALEDKFEEFILNMVRSQALSRAMDSFMQPLFALIDQAALEGGVSEDEMDTIINKANEIFPQLNEFLKELYNSFGLGADGSLDSLSALQQGIQSITEPQAAAIEAYLNTLRFEMFRQTEIFSAMLLAMQSVGSLNSPENSIVYKELVTQTALLRSMDSRLASVIKEGGANGAYVQTNL